METLLSHNLQQNLSLRLTKRCALCKAVKPRNQFWKDKRPDRDLGPYCLDCRKIKQREFRVRHRERLNLLNRTKHSELRWKRHLRAKYGISPKQYEEMLFVQGGACAICKSKTPSGQNGCSRFHVDHEHGTTNIRGLLCSKCNQMLGYANDRPDILRTAAEYLERPQVAQAFIQAFDMRQE
jgi:hypothetical protein